MIRDATSRGARVRVLTVLVLSLAAVPAAVNLYWVFRVRELPIPKGRADRIPDGQGPGAWHRPLAKPLPELARQLAACL